MITKQRMITLYLILLPIFLIVSLLSSKTNNGHKQDFAVYWQAGYMILNRGNVYDSPEWLAQRELLQTALHAEPTFNYPLPLAVLFAPFALLPVQTSYTIWLFIAQIAILTSIVILLGFSIVKSRYLEVLTIACIFLFRPTFSVIVNGQIVSALLLALSISILLFHKNRWFWGGFTLSLLSLKPSIGFPILALAGIWLLFGREWKGILGIASGCITLFAIGFAVDPQWVNEYLKISTQAFNKYYGMHATLWGVADALFKDNQLSMLIGACFVSIIILMETYYFYRNPSNNTPVEAMAYIVPAGLLIAPHSWAYNQILLTVSIVYLVMRISISYREGTAIFLLCAIVILSLALVFIAYFVLHDVWSFLNSFAAWLLALYFRFHKTNHEEIFGTNTVSRRSL